MKKPTLNYLVDVVITLAFVGSALSGVVFLIPIDWLAASDGGFPTLLGVDFLVWDTLHTYSSLLLIAGVLVHFILHWSWIVVMTKRTLRYSNPSSC